MSTALAVVAPSTQVTPATTALEPTSAEQAFWLAERLVKSGLLGRAIQRPEAAFAVILAGRELGLTAMQSLRSLHVIEGKPTMSADLMAALVKRSPLCKSFRLIKSTPEIATYETERVGEGVTSMSFTIEEARAAGVTGKDNWKKYPSAMLRARCIAALSRVVYPDLMLGIYEQDEIAAPQADAKSARVEVAPVAPTAPAEPAVDDETREAVERWSMAMLSAADMEELERCRAECKVEVKDGQALLRIGASYAQRKRELT